MDKVCRQINDILVTVNNASQSIWIATSAGLVKAPMIEYTRGKDYVGKVRGLYGGAPKDFRQPSPALLEWLMPENYLTALAKMKLGKFGLVHVEMDLLLWIQLATSEDRERKKFRDCRTIS
ncbi:MAG: hypothetical protein LBJ00_11795 [Planctomycetaceae bacterium]|jgi:hypothetical protein|nr:hypothetical protein [Planctomycetaceae bacterium]